jgi:hypothetical protein
MPKTPASIIVLVVLGVLSAGATGAPALPVGTLQLFHAILTGHVNQVAASLI